MTVDLAALAKLASEATPGPWRVTDTSAEYDGEPEIGTPDDPHAVLCRGHGYDDYGSIETRDVAYIAAASPDVVLALVRVALTARAAANLIHMADWDPPTLHEAILRADSTLRAALADLDHD